MLNRYARAMVRAAAAATLLWGCGSSPDTSREALSVYGNTRTLEIAPVLLAADRIYRPGTAVRLGGIPNLVGEANVFSDGDSNAADIATHADTQLLRYSLEHPEVRVVMTVAEGHYRIVARRSAGIETLSDLAGKRVATMPDTSAHYFLVRMLGSVGLTDDAVEIVDIRPLADIPRALADGRVDAVAIWEPEIENAAHMIGDDLVEFANPGIYRERFNLHSTVEKLGDPVVRAEIVAFVRATMDAAARINEDPSVAIPLVAEASGFDQNLIARSWEHQSYPGYLAPDLLDMLVEEEAWLAQRANRPARSREELAHLIDGSVIEDAMMRP